MERTFLLVAFAATLALPSMSLGCGNAAQKEGEAKTEAKSDEEESEESDPKQDSKKKKKKKKKKEPGEEKEPTAATSDAPAAQSGTAAPPPIAATALPPPPTAEQPANGELTTAIDASILFTGDVPADVKFLRQKNLKGQPVWVQVLPDWETSRDDLTIDYVDDALQLYSKENHAQIWYGALSSTITGEPQNLDFQCQRVGAPGCKFGPAVEGRFGGAPGMPARIAKGTATRGKATIEVFWIVAEFKPGQSLLVLASLKKDVYPKFEKQLIATMRSTKVAGP